jgi:rRNA-processing protein FCF1
MKTSSAAHAIINQHKFRLFQIMMKLLGYYQLAIVDTNIRFIKHNNIIVLNWFLFQ